MLRHGWTLLPAVTLLFGLGWARAQTASPDAFMGDWQGTLRGADGAEKPLCAQVICWGRGDYQANLLDAFDQRIKPVAVLRGKLAAGAVAFGDTAKIADGAFTGTLTGERAGAFKLAHVVRLSPALGAKPPAGAVILFDGTGLDAWQVLGDDPWTIDLARLIGGDNRVAYLRARVWSPKAQPAVLEVGSDDGVKAWLNGTVVHSNNASRPLTPFQDKVNIELQEGWNKLLLKVIQGGGNWSACARVRGRDGKDLDGLKFEPLPKAGVDLQKLRAESSGTMLTWELAGPFTQEGKDGPALVDVAFPPETDDPGVQWRVVNDNPTPQRQWKLVEGGAMEVVPGAGSVMSLQSFKDHQVHLEFRTPFEPEAREQARGNSGVYLQGRYEIQVLDSYGLEGRNNECGAIYGLTAPLINMCAPPLQWQSYDVEFRAARRDAATNKVEGARMTVRHNGVLVQDNVLIPVDSIGNENTQSGGLYLQDHGNRVQYRNIWVVEK